MPSANRVVAVWAIRLCAGVLGIVVGAGVLGAALGLGWKMFEVMSR